MSPVQEQHWILLVDDEPVFAEMLRIVLESEGFPCESATNMTDAVRFLHAQNFSVVVTDIMMPPGPDFENINSSETGYHLIRLLQTKWPQVRVVCLSVIGDQKKIATLRRQKVQYLRKGEVSLQEAVKTIRRAATGMIRF